MTDRIFDGMLAIGHEIAGLPGAGDTGAGGGEYEVYIERGGIEYRVKVQPYWDNESDTPLGEEWLIAFALGQMGEITEQTPNPD